MMCKNHMQVMVLVFSTIFILIVTMLHVIGKVCDPPRTAAFCFMVMSACFASRFTSFLWMQPAGVGCWQGTVVLHISSRLHANWCHRLNTLVDQKLQHMVCK
jgi:hypothetical protein